MCRKKHVEFSFSILEYIDLILLKEIRLPTLSFDVDLHISALDNHQIMAWLWSFCCGQFWVLLNVWKRVKCIWYLVTEYNWTYYPSYHMLLCLLTGPASREVKTLQKMMMEGMNIARLNFSHGTYEVSVSAFEVFKC